LKTNLPNLQWILLKSLATENGTITVKDMKADSNLKSQKYLLSKKLREIFGIDDDPFYRYSTGMGYHIKITLIP